MGDGAPMPASKQRKQPSVDSSPRREKDLFEEVNNPLGQDEVDARAFESES
jgi:hypothetical protein